MTEQRTVAVVRVEPDGIELAVAEGESLMRAAERLGYRWPTLCHGEASCTVCAIILDEPDAFVAAEGPELEGLRLFEGRSFYEGKSVRLACQARPLRDTTVLKRGVRRID